MEFTGSQSVVTYRWDCIFLNHIEKKSQTKLNQVLDGRVIEVTIMAELSTGRPKVAVAA